MAKSSTENVVDGLTRTLFGFDYADPKIKRVVSPPCPVCGRRGYCVSVCVRRSLREAGAPGVDEFSLRWQYLARLLFSSGVRRPDVCRSAPTKGGRMP